MKNILAFVIAIVLLSSNLYSKDQDKTILFDGSRYTYQGKQINMNQMLSLMEKDSEEFELMSSGKSTGGLVTVLSTIGGGLIGWPIGTYLGGGEPNWTLAYIGGALVVISIPFAIGADNDIRKAVAMHNEKQALTYNERTYELRFFATSNGIGLSLQF